MRPLAELEVMVADVQATAAGPRGRLLEIGWARVPPSNPQATARLIQLPEGEAIPPAVARITGISRAMMHDAVTPDAAWREFAGDRAQLRHPAPIVAHFARFERPFLTALAGSSDHLHLVCTHDIARRLLPGLPRCSLRALAGYFGRAVGLLRRSADHVEATAFVWSELVRMLEAQGVTSWYGLQDWLAGPARAGKPRKRVWPLPRQLRLSAPAAPGVYRFLRTSGDVLYVGKASSLHHRVNSYFQKQHGVPERMLEMLSQVRAVSFEVTPTALEAALLESDEIKRHRPPYNIALTEEHQLWFAAPDLSVRGRRVSAQCPVGPFRSGQTLEQFATIATGGRAVPGVERGGPPATVFDEGYARLCAAHRELSRDATSHSRLLRLGSRLWAEGRRDGESGSHEGWTPEYVQFWLERVALRAALARRRARWLTRLTDSALVWRERGADAARLVVVENGEISLCESVAPGAVPPVPPGYHRGVIDRQDNFTVARFDRLRVLTTEMKRLVSEGAPASLRLGVSPVLADARLAYALSWV